MKKLLVLPSMLLGTLLVALPMMANDIPTTGEPTGMDNVAAGSDAAVRILTGSRVAWFDKVLNWQTGTSNVTENGTFDFGVLNIDLTGINAVTGTVGTNYSGIHTNAHSGTFNLGAGTINIDAAGGDTIRGFRHLGGTFSGTITGGTDITVIATDSFYATAVGFATSPTIGSGSFQDADITFGNLTAITLLPSSGISQGSGSGATAFRSGDFTGTGTGTHVDLGTLTAVTEYSGPGVVAIGAHIGAINTGSSLTIEGIAVESGGSAGGLLSADGPSANFYALDGNVTIGSGGINVKGHGDSYGIKAASIANLELKGDIEVTSTTGGSVGIHNIGNFTGNVLGGRDITAKGDDLAVGFGVGGQIQNGANIQLGNITAAGTGTNGYAKDAVGFVSVGTLTGGNIVVDTITVRGDDRAAGFGVGDMAVGATANVTGGSITVTEIDVTTANGDAIGWFSGEVGNSAALDLGTITVKANADGGASGLYVVGDFAGKLSFDEIRATGSSNGANATTSGITVLDGKLNAAAGSSVGKIYAEASDTAANEHVYGVVVDEDKITGSSAGSSFTATNDVTAVVKGSASAGEAVGIALRGGTSVVTVNNGAIVTAKHEGSAFAVGIDMVGSDNTITINSGTVQAINTGTGGAVGISMVGANAAINAAAGTVISAFAEGASTDAVGVEMGTITTDNKILGVITAQNTQGLAVGWGSGAVTATGKITINEIDAVGDGAIGFVVHGTTAENSQVKITKIEAEGNLDAVGAWFQDNVHGNVAIDNISVQSATGPSDGLFLGGANNTGQITLGKVDVTSLESAAYGVRTIGDITGNITATDKITVIGGTSATGFAAYGANNTGNITLGDIEVWSGTGDADGLFLGGSQDHLGKITVGKVDVTSQEANAYGIYVESGEADLFVSNNITANASAGQAFGIHAAAGADNTWVTFSDNVTIIAKDGAIDAVNCVDIAVAAGKTFTAMTSESSGADGTIYSGNSISIDLKAGAEMNVGSITAEAITGTTHPGVTVWLGNNAFLNAGTTTSGSNLTILGNGNANLDVVHVSGDFNIGAGTDRTTVTVDGVKMLDAGGWLGDVRFGEAGTLQIFGNTHQVGAIGFLADAAQVGHIMNLATFTKWGYNRETGNIESFGVRDRVFANDNYLAAGAIHNRFTGWHAVRDHVISGGTQISQGYGYYGQSPCDCAYGCAPTGCSHAKQSRGAWANYVGRDSRYQSSFNGNDWNIGTNGVQVGTDFWRTRRSQFGAFFGYEDSTASNFADQIKAQDYYVGAYAVHVFNGGADFRSVFNFGWQDFDTRRVGLWGDVYNTSFRGNTAEVNLELGKRYYCGGPYGMWSTRPTIAVDWFWTHLGGGQERPINEDALRYHKTDFSQLFFRFGTDLRYEHGRWAVESGIYYSYDMRGSDFWSRVSDAQTNTYHSTLVSSKLGRSIVSVNVGGSYLVGKNLTLFGGYRGEAAGDRAGRGYEHIGYVGGAWRW